MSRWLLNVGNFLEKLDEGAERVVEDRIVGGTNDALNDVPEDIQLQSILTARGLSKSENDEEVDDYDNSEGDSGNFLNAAAKSIQKQETSEGTPPEAANDSGETEPFDDEEKSAEETALSQSDGPDNGSVSENDPKLSELEKNDQALSSSTSLQEVTGSDTEAGQGDPTASQGRAKAELKTPVKAQMEANAPLSGSEMNMAMQALTPNNHAILRESQKEARTLRRHVVSLNKQLEHAEAELQAQRVELERAAERLEKDRLRYKEDREKEKNRQAEEIKALKAQNEKGMKELKQRADKQLEEIRKQLRDVEERRMQEGGDWNKELIDAVQREKEMAEKYAILEDEKGTLLSQISILQDQQEALGSRIESLSHTAENAMERERESDMRLDEALSLHARQIAQRQARESELERTVSELGSALVAARSVRSNLSLSGGSNNTSAGQRGNNNSASTPAGEDSGSPEARLQALEQDMEGLIAQLNFEKQRSETLQNELRDVSRERTDEATANHSRQIKYDRQVAELSHTIARLESELRSSSNDREGKRAFSAAAEKEDAKHVRELSEELLIQREKLANNNSEISALKSRLKVATERLQTAESALEAAESRMNEADDWRADSDMEQPPSSGGGIDGGMRRRGGGPFGGIKRSSRNRKEVSMRAALNLDAIRSQSSEHIGKALDGMDAFLRSSGKFLRHNALARFIFIAYLLALHAWTFVLIVLHAHGFETVHGDFGAGQGISHGPHALMQERQVPGAVMTPDQVPPVAVDAADGIPGHA